MQTNEDISALVEAHVRSAVRDSHQELLQQIGTMVDKISGSTTCTSSPSTSACQLSALDVPKFRRKSNEEQYKQNSRVLSRLEQAESSLESGQIEATKASIAEAKDLVKRRQKHIQLADNSDLGWRVVAEYEANPIASDSEDEKRMYRAEARATRKAKSDRSRRRYRGSPYKRPDVPSGVQTGSQLQSSTARKPGLCFVCGKAGHWKNECLQAQSNNKISTFSVVFKSIGTAGKGKCTSTEETGYSESTECVSSDQDRTRELDSHVSELSPVGRLKRHMENWVRITNNQYMLNVIDQGYRLPFRTVPTAVKLRNNKSARDNPIFVSEQINVLLKKGVITQVRVKPAVVNPLTVAYNRSGKPRLVLDCRHINPCLHVFKVKFDDIRLAEVMFDKCSFIFTFDLKSAYHHIDIFEEHRTYLGFAWIEEGVEKFYVYNSLPFGIATAGHIFTKLLRVMVQYWRSLSIRALMFLDDGIGGDRQYERALQASETVRSSLLQVGFLLADDKCDWVPHRVGCWLGHVLDYNDNRLFISNERICRLEQSIRSALGQLTSDNQIMPVRFLASVIGQIISLQSVIGKGVSLYTRFLYKCILERLSWNSRVYVTDEAISELVFWQENARKLNLVGKPLRDCKTVEVLLFSDASHVGYGGYVEMLGGKGTSSVCRRHDTWQVGLKDMDCDVDIHQSGSVSECVQERSVGNVTVTLPEVSFFSHENGNTELPEESDGYVWSDNGSVTLPEVSGIWSGVLGLLHENEGLHDEIGRLPEESYTLTQDVVHSDYSASGRIESVDKLVGVEYVSHERRVVSPDVEVCEFNSKTGGSGECVEVYGSWSLSESEKSSTWRELEAVRRVMINLKGHLLGKHIKILSDNQNVGRILVVGSNNSELHGLALSIAGLCREHDITFVPEWIPRAGIGLKQSLKRKFDEAGASIPEEQKCIDTMASQILGSRADSTVEKYSHLVKAFDDFCSDRHLPNRPAHAIHVALYISHLIDIGKSYSVISSAYYAIKWLHELNDFADPTCSSTVSRLLECAKRQNSRPITKKDVITTEHLIQLCDSYVDCKDVLVLRDLCMILLGFSGFLRFNEISALRCSDIEFKSDHFIMHIRKSKTDIYRSGKHIPITKGLTSACPYVMLERYMNAADLSLHSDMFLFRPGCRSGAKCFLLRQNKPLSYSRAKECIVSRLHSVAPSLKLGTHSLRASGATAAANAEGVSERCLKRHGRWKSDLAKDGYVDDSLDKKLFITKQLHL